MTKNGKLSWNSGLIANSKNVKYKKILHKHSFEKLTHPGEKLTKTWPQSLPNNPEKFCSAKRFELPVKAQYSKNL